MRHVHGGVDTAESATLTAEDVSAYAERAAPNINARRSSIALLTPYNGGNLGDASILDAVVANIGRRLPDAQFTGICLNCANFVERHGVGAFPLAGRNIPWYSVWAFIPRHSPPGEPSQTSRGVWGRIKVALKSVPVLWQCLRVAAIIPREIFHSVGGYRFLRTQDLLVVSGGGQLNEQYGGGWGQPFALFKWAVLARIARVPYVVVSVGAGKVASMTARRFVAAALRMACYRSYRDKNSREVATGLLQRTAEDPVVPDLAFSLSSSQLQPPAGIRAIAQHRTVIAMSPIAYAKPGMWPSEDSALHNRYVQEMAEVVSQLLMRGYFLVIVCSSLGDDESVIPELLGRLDDQSKQRIAGQMHIPTIATWRDLVAALRDVDLLIASRLHSTILGFVSETPTIAISFDSKVDWVMEDLGQTDYLLQIRDFTSKDVIKALDRLELQKDVFLQQVASYRRRILPGATSQYDVLADLAMARCRRH